MTGPVRTRLTWMAFILAILLGACATLPPPAAVQDLKSIAGKWDLSFRGPDWQTSETVAIREDGTAEWTTPRGKQGTYSFVVQGGIIHWKSSSGASGTVTLREGEGKRVLTWTLDGCANCDGQSTPVK